MSKIIAITGTHGTGKTTLTFQIAAEYKKHGANVKIIQEVARTCPFPLNELMTKETAHWIYFEHSKKEIEALRCHDVVITDRTSYDSFVYAKHLDLEYNTDLHDCAYDHLYEYDEIYLVRPSQKRAKPDGTRSTSRKFQIAIDFLFVNAMGKFMPEEIDSVLIFGKEHEWNISYP